MEYPLMLTSVGSFTCAIKHVSEMSFGIVFSMNWHPNWHPNLNIIHNLASCVYTDRPKRLRGQRSSFGFRCLFYLSQHSSAISRNILRFNEVIPISFPSISLSTYWIFCANKHSGNKRFPLVTLSATMSKKQFRPLNVCDCNKVFKPTRQFEYKTQ